MKRLMQWIVALALPLYTSAAWAQQAVVVDFYGESTFRGWGGGIERDDNPIPATKSNPDSPYTTSVQQDVAVGGNYANTPRRALDRYFNNPGDPNIPKRNNFAMSSTPLSATLNGTWFQAGVATLSGGTEGLVAVINSGLNDAVQSTNLSTFRSQLKQVVERLLRTGKKVIIVRPNQFANNGVLSFTQYMTYASALSAYYNNLIADEYSANSLYDSTNLKYVDTGVIAGPDGTHPDNAGYESMAAAIASALPSHLTDATYERMIAQYYVLFYKRAVESGGGNYWLTQLKSTSEVSVCQTIYSLSPEYQGLTSAQIVTKFYNNLLDANPDSGALTYWTNYMNSYGVGQTAVAILSAVRGYDYKTNNQKKLLVHRTNAGVAYGFRLKRATVDTSGLMSTITTDPATVYTAMQTR